MEKYYKKYYILNSYTDRCKSITVKALDNNEGYINLAITVNGKEIRQNLYLLGFDNKGGVVFNEDIKSAINIDRINFKRVENFAVILNKQNACSLEYLQMENKQKIIKNFEMYRFYSFKKSGQQNKNNTDKSKKNYYDSDKTNKSINQNRENENKQNKTSQHNQTHDLSDMMKTFSKATNMLNNLNNIQDIQKPSEQQEIKAPLKDSLNPFTKTFPNSEWVKTEFHGNSGYWHYLSGKIYENDKLAYKAIAVPGEYSMTPPAWLDGLSKYYVCDTPYANGYWIMFTDPESGNIVNAPQSSS